VGRKKGAIGRGEGDKRRREGEITRSSDGATNPVKLFDLESMAVGNNLYASIIILLRG
jgi:hypothetical protein